MIPFPASIEVQDLQVEIEKLEKSWVRGDLEPLREIVMQFVWNNLDILQKDTETPLSIRVQNLIMDFVSLDIQAELRDQAHEISKEVWFAGERGTHLPEDVKTQWIFDHAKNWRSWRIKEYLYVAFKSEMEIASLLRYSKA